MNQKQTDAHSSEFEQWAAKEGLRMTKRGNGDYVAPFTAIAWKAWQAAKKEETNANTDNTTSE